MSYSPTGLAPERPMISLLSSPYTRVILGGAAPLSSAWPTANKAIYIPIKIRQNITITQFWTANGTSAANTRDVGIYSWDGTKIASTGSTAGSGTSTLQAYNVTDFTISPGMYYLALSSSSTTSQYSNLSASLRFEKPLGVLMQLTAFPLPATMTPAAYVDVFIPIFGLSTVPTV